MKCPRCGAETRERDDFCGTCGQLLRHTEVACLQCGNVSLQGDKFCVMCGEPLQIELDAGIGGGEVVVMSKKRLKAAIVTITLLGTTAGAFYGVQATNIILIVAVISSFFSCLVLSLMFTRIMVRRNWAGGLGLSLLFGSIAGATSGGITGFAMSYTEVSLRDEVFNFVFTSTFGAGLGIAIGLFSSLVMWLIFKPKVEQAAISDVAIPQDISTNQETQSVKMNRVSPNIVLILGAISSAGMILSLLSQIAYNEAAVLISIPLGFSAPASGIIGLVLGIMSLRSKPGNIRRVMIGIILCVIGISRIILTRAGF